MIFVSAQTGNDANSGTLAAPVRQISAAIALAAAGDTVLVLDSGDYGAFTISKSLAVVADGVHAQVTGLAAPTGGRAVTVSAGATDVVVLRGLSVRGEGATVGIACFSGRLRVERSTISGFSSSPDGFPSRGIDANGPELTVLDTVLRDNGNGISFSGQVRAVIERCRFAGNRGPNGVGVTVGANQRIAIADSVIADYDIGCYIRGVVGSPLAALTLSRSTITNNRIGIYADRTGQVHLTKSVVSLNDDGLFTLNAGIIYTAGDNAVLGNFTTNIGAGTVFFASDITS